MIASRRVAPSCRLLIILLALLLASAPLQATPARPSAVAAAADAWYAALAPSARAEVVTKHDGNLSRVTLETIFETRRDRISGTMRIDFVNATGETLTDIGFRLYPNATYYGEGDATISEPAIDGVAVVPAYEAASTAFRLPLADPLAPDGRATIAFRFTIIVPDDSTGTFGVFRHDQSRDTWALADWHPIIAGWDRDRGWRLDPPTPAGDPTFADAALYDLTMRLPAAYDVISGGTVLSATTDSAGSQTVRLVTGPARDLTLVVAPSLEPTVATVGETEVRVWANPYLANPAVVADMIALTTASLEAYGERFGPYPFAELDIVATSLDPSVLGVTWSGLIMLNAAYLLEGSTFPLNYPNTLAFMIVHEVGHLWYGIGVGVDSNDHPYLAEGLTNAVAMDVAGEIVGNERARAMMETQVVGLYGNALATSDDGIVDTPIGSETAAGPGRIPLAYGKGALGFLAIRLAMGDDAWFAAMDAWTADWLFRISEPTDLRAALVAHAPPGVDVDELWSRWFEQAVTSLNEISTVALAIGPLLGN